MIELRLLGRVSLTGPDGLQVRSLLGQPRRLALLAYLAAPPRGMHRRDTLLALFWPELDQAHARNALRQALHVLRSALGSSVTSDGDEAIGLDFEQVWCDVVAFDRAMAGGELREALDLYRGGLLDGFFISDAPEFERWLETERARLRESAARAARDLGEHSEARGDFTTAVHWARRAAQLAPNDEAALRRLIAVLDRHGDRAGALEAYEGFAERLAAEYEAEPAAETQALIAAVRARDRAVPPVQLPTVDVLPRLRAGLADRYRVERELARGRTAAVFLAHDRKHDRPVAIKVLHPELAAAVGSARFLLEIQLAAHLHHPHIVSLYDSGETDGLLYFVMPHVKGESLRDRLQREPQLPIPEAVRIAGDVVQALGYAHGEGVVHRDIKPENILLEVGHALVADFGIARAITAAGSDRLTETGIALGTPAYMSPEQGAEDGQVDGRSDLYALGCVAYEMLAGTPPFTGPTAQAILARHAVDPVAPIRTVRETVPPGVERAVLKALAKVPADRYPDAAAFAQALAAPSAEPAQSASLRSGRRARLGLGIALAAGFALLFGLNVGGWRNRARKPYGGGWTHSVAVLPLENRSSDATQEAFADGMTTALITDLGRIPALRVMSKEAVTAFKGTTLAPRAIGESLHVEAFIQGSMERASDRLRFNVALIDASTGKELWTQQFEEPARNRFAVQDSIAGGVREALGLPAASAEAGPPRTPPTSNLEAYDLYLRGKIRLRQQSLDNNRVAIGLFERAVVLDPNFAAAQAELSRAYAQRGLQFAREDTLAFERAEVAVEKALRLDPNLAEAHADQGRLLWGAHGRFAHERAIAEYRRALALNPNLDEAHHELGNIYMHIGLLDKAVEELQHALLISPRTDNALRRLGETHTYRGEYDEALRIERQVDPEANAALWTYQVALILMHLGRKDEAFTLIQGYLKTHPEDRGGVVTSVRAAWYAMAGDSARAEQDIQTAVQKGTGYIHFHHAAFHIALAYALMRRPGEAVRWLRTAADGGLPCYPLFNNDPFLDNIRRDPGFVTFLNEQKAQWMRWRETL